MANLKGWTGFAAALQFEDALLFVWLVVVTPLLEFLLGGLLRGLSLGSIDRSAPHATALGIVFILATLLAISCTITRAPGDQVSPDVIADGTFGYAHLPMVAAIGIIGFLGLELLGLDDAAVGLMCLWFGLFGITAMIHNRMPVIDFTLRRVMMTPFIILSTTIFTSSINPLFSGVDPNSLMRFVSSQFGQFQFGLILAAVLVYYLMFVFAPRLIAGSGGSWLEWGLRFLFYVVGLILNIGILQAV